MLLHYQVMVAAAIRVAVDTAHKGKEAIHAVRARVHTKWIHQMSSIRCFAGGYGGGGGGGGGGYDDYDRYEAPPSGWSFVRSLLYFE